MTSHGPVGNAGERGPATGQPGGSSALDTASALVEAAAAAGVGLLMLPVYYRRGGLDGSPLSGRP